MSQLLGIFRHEFGMSIRRKGLWIAYGLLFLLYGIVIFSPSPVDGSMMIIPEEESRAYAGQLVMMFNMFMPLVGGILAADRMQRDVRLQIRELQLSTPAGRAAYILGKYFGVLFSLLLPVLIWIVLSGLLASLILQAPLGFTGLCLAAFAAATIPAFAFVVAFSLACPLIMPVRIYQILFTGYWFWGNYLNPDVFPTLNQTLLTPGGRFVIEAFFGDFTGTSDGKLFTPLMAWANLAVLGLCILAVLLVLDRYLARQARKA